MLYLEFAARIRGCLTRKEIIAFGEGHLEELRSELGILENGVPSELTLHRMEKGIDSDEFARLYSEFALALAEANGSGGQAPDPEAPNNVEVITASTLFIAPVRNTLYATPSIASFIFLSSFPLLFQE